MEPKKDAWYWAYKNFVQLSYLGAFIFIVLAVLFVIKSDTVQGMSPIAVLLPFAIGITAWFSLGQLFKKRDKRGIRWGYILLGIFLLVSIFTINIVGILINAYFLSLIYRASKIPA